MIKPADFDDGNSINELTVTVSNNQHHLEETNTFKTYKLATWQEKKMQQKYFPIFMKVALHGYRHQKQFTKLSCLPICVLLKMLCSCVNILHFCPSSRVKVS